eukprot:5902376-Alexandrium_andersonii.AAC.1
MVTTKRVDGCAGGAFRGGPRGGRSPHREGHNHRNTSTGGKGEFRPEGEMTEEVREPLIPTTPLGRRPMSSN